MVAAASGIAVIIPCYNLGETIEETVASVLAQSRPASEVVVVDDGSTDPHTQEVLAQLGGHGVVVVPSPNLGVARARDLGVESTASPYLLWLDADDLLAPTFLAETAAVLDAEPDCEFVATGYRLIGEADATWIPPDPEDLVGHLARGSFCITSLLRRRLWEHVGGCDAELVAAEDWDFWLRVLEGGHRGRVIREPLFLYRIRTGSRDQRGLQRGAFEAGLRAVLEKHRPLIERLGPAVLAAKREHLAHQQRYRRAIAAVREAHEATLRECLAKHCPTAAGSGQPVEARDPRRSVVRSPRPAPGAVILCYHRVAALHPDPFGLCVPPELFRAHLEHLQTCCQPMTLDDLLSALDSGVAPDRAVALTFDDGYRDAFTASELLGERGIPATFYVNTERLDEPHEAWQEVLESIFLSEAPIPPLVELTLAAAPLVLPSAGRLGRRAAFDALYTVGRALSPLGRQGLVTEVMAWSGLPLVPRDSHRVLLGEEIRELARRPGHAIGAHTTHHALLPVHPLAMQRREMVACKACLEALLGRPLRSLAYPYGEASRETIAAARQAGFCSALGTCTGLVRPWSDPLALPRVEVEAWPVAELARRLDALFRAG